MRAKRTRRKKTNNEHDNTINHNADIHFVYQHDLQRLKNRYMKEITLEPSVMIEELMFWIHQNEMSGDAIDPANRWLPLYLELQKLKDKLDKVNKDRHDLYVSVKNDETK